VRREARLAKAAGKELGDVLSLDLAEPPEVGWMPQYMGGENSPIVQYLERQRRGSDAVLAVGSALGKLEHRVAITASFAFKAK